MSLGGSTGTLFSSSYVPWQFYRKTVFLQSPLSELFKPEVGSWECSGCYIRNRGDVVLCPACQTLKPGVKSEDVKAPSQNLFVAPSDGGFVFGGVDIKKVFLFSQGCQKHDNG